jgi:hypothetical protein
LTTERATIQRQHRQPLGSCIDRGCQTRRPGADDDHVINLFRIDRFDEADATGEFDIPRIAQQLSIGTENDRQITGGDVEALDQGLRARIGLGVKSLVWMPVASKEPLKAKYIGMISAADDHRPDGARIEKTNSAQDQGAHDAFAQFGLFDHQIAQPAR